MKALLVRLSSIGDVVHTLPALEALHRNGWQAGWLAESAGADLLEGHPLLAHLVRAPAAKGFTLAAARGTTRALREQRYDVAFEFQGLWKSALWARFAGAGRVLGFAGPWRREPLSALLVRELAPLPGDVHHVIDKNLALLRPLGIEAVGLRQFPLPPTEAQGEQVECHLAAIGVGEFVVLNPGGGWASKLWPPERYGAVARALHARGLRSVVTWGPGEEPLADRVVAASGGAALKCFPTSLLELVELARRARLVVAADTGPLHISCAVGTPVVGVYGPTDPARNGPFSAADQVVRRVPLCSPCHRRRCRVHEGVMVAITADEVVRAIDRHLGTRPPAKSDDL